MLSARVFAPSITRCSTSSVLVLHMTNLRTAAHDETPHKRVELFTAILRVHLNFGWQVEKISSEQRSVLLMVAFTQWRCRCTREMLVAERSEAVSARPCSVSLVIQYLEASRLEPTSSTAGAVGKNTATGDPSGDHSRADAIWLQQTSSDHNLMKCLLRPGCNQTRDRVAYISQHSARRQLPPSNQSLPTTPTDSHRTFARIGMRLAGFRAPPWSTAHSEVPPPFSSLFQMLL
ncbi:hypothetical protein GGR56DRAFT_270676 [Xylariaceae sp. FL0804]|nr:hypothetical protein GGR56DRAFT_270676 [Xylariaceae sp. FL0804]